MEIVTTLSQAAGGIPTNWHDFVQLGGMAGIAAVLLWHTLRRSQESDKALSAIACTIVALQKAMIVMETRAFAHAAGKSMDEQCQECKAAFDRLLVILDEQEKTLTRIYTVQK